MSETTTPIAFKGEVQFRRYTDSSKQGPAIILGLHDRDDLDKFIGEEGSRYMMVLVKIGPGDEAIRPGGETRIKIGPRCMEANQLCAEKEFQQWAALQAGGGAQPNEYTAKGVILLWCDIKSRKELDANEAAFALFQRRVRAPYYSYRRSRQA